ncbi:MAG: hypothetical protein F6K28_08020 [Microcoleus sp. SIO2G3]|nr:hypothetical protein [Microcoleus sp. SIO2G3]
MPSLQAWLRFIEGVLTPTPLKHMFIAIWGKEYASTHLGDNSPSLAY